MKTTEKILSILREEIVPAEGCTEPIALAYAAALAADALGTNLTNAPCSEVQTPGANSTRIPDKMTVYLSGNMIKNVKSVHIPNTDNKVGIETAVAMGAILGDASRKLMVIADVDKTRLGEVDEYVRRGTISIQLEKECPKLYIRIEATSGSHNATVEISDYHTSVTRYDLDGRNLLDKGSGKCSEFKETMTDRSFLTIDLICETARTIDINLIKPLFEEVIEKNSAIAREGLQNVYGIAIGKTIFDGIKEGSYGDDIRNNLAAFAAAGSDARMNGCPLPVMTTSGSGNQGMTCSLPIIRFCDLKGKSREELIRGLFVSHMTTIHIKEVIGRLSAYCGAMAASAGVAGALAWIDGLELKQVEMAVETTLATVSGIICDGAKSSCATKIATGVSMAVDAYFAAKKGRGLSDGEGIVGRDIEKTINSVGTLGCDGMAETDDVILDIMMKG